MERRTPSSAGPLPGPPPGPDVRIPAHSCPFRQRTAHLKEICPSLDQFSAEIRFNRMTGALNDVSSRAAEPGLPGRSDTETWSVS